MLSVVAMSDSDDVTVRAVKAAGGPVAMSKALSQSGRRITSQAIGQWRRVPGERVLEVETLTGISRHDLRPDVYGPAPKPRSEVA